jgi:hypothetical protein
MADGTDSPGLGVVVVLAGVLGVVHLGLGGLSLFGGLATTAATVLAVSQAVLGGLLFPTAAGLAMAAPWGRYLGIVTFGGIAVVQLLPLLAGETLAVPLLGIGLAGGSALYLIVAGEVFGDEGDERAISQETDPHRFVR